MRPCAPSSACNGTWLRRGECRRSHLCGFTAGVRSVPLLMQAAAQRCPPGQGGTFSPPPETVMCERVAGLHRKEERVLPCPARQPLVTARSVRRRGARALARSPGRTSFPSSVRPSAPSPARPRSGPNEGAHGKIFIGRVPSGMFCRQGSRYFWDWTNCAFY